MADQPLAGRVAAVTGASSGIGAATAMALSRAGATVALAARRRDRLEDLAAKLEGESSIHEVDVSDEQQARSFIESANAEHGGLHVLVNNAGIVRMATPEACTLDDFRFHNAVMNEGVFLGCKYAIPALKASGGGSIINMSSVASHLGYPVYFAYSAAKGAVRAMTKSIAVHCQMMKYNIRCNSIHAGAIDTAMVRDSTKQLGMEMSAWEQSPTGLGQPDDVANLVLFLASDESRFVNGAELLIDNALIVQ
jgi:3(or 17)beta-hydroxysteroid dehydrogenase